MDHVPARRLPDNLYRFPSSPESLQIARRIMHLQHAEMIEIMRDGRHCPLPRGLSLHNIDRESLGGLLVNSVLQGHLPESELPDIHPKVKPRLGLPG